MLRTQIKIKQYTIDCLVAEDIIEETEPRFYKEDIQQDFTQNFRRIVSAAPDKVAVLLAAYDKKPIAYFRAHGESKKNCWICYPEPNHPVLMEHFINNRKASSWLVVCCNGGRYALSGNNIFVPVLYPNDEVDFRDLRNRRKLRLLNPNGIEVTPERQLELVTDFMHGLMDFRRETLNEILLSSDYTIHTRTMREIRERYGRRK